MDSDDIVVLNETMRDLYTDFDGLTVTMAEWWLDDLRHLESALVREGLRRWVRQHTDKPPTLDQLLEQVEFVRDDQRTARRNSGRSDVSALDVLREAAQVQESNPERSPDDATYVGLMLLLTERSIARWQDDGGTWHAPLSQEQRGEQCYDWAEQYRNKRPQLAQDLEAAGRQFWHTIPLAFGD
jgi:hypothetical protein